ncbi:unnamed protein product [Fusarium langsethiae]|nr:unnamed protein product [Fusarium langsethiae]
MAQTSTDLVFISWNKIYCLLPLPTIKRHKFFAFKPFDVDIHSTLREYTAAGWTIRDLIWPDKARELTPREALQQIGGQRSLVIDLANPPRGEFTPDHVLENNVFSLDWSKGFPDGRRRLIVGALLLDEKPTLQYMHTTGRVGMAQASWKQFLGKKLAHWEHIQILKVFHELDPSFCRSTWYTCPVCESSVTSTWDYADEHISTWFQEWRNQEATLALLPSAPKDSSEMIER